jgi:hypothetical protein
MGGRFVGRIHPASSSRERPAAWRVVPQSDEVRAGFSREGGGMSPETGAATMALRADDALKRGDLAGARELLSQLVSDHPDFAYGYLQLGLVERAARHPREARAAFERAATIGHPSAMYELACDLVKNGDLDAATGWLIQAAQSGFHDYERLLRDVSLAALRARQDWPARGRELERLMRPAMHETDRRQLDFWLGIWEVRTRDGRLVGHNRITRELAGAAILERWTSIAGWRGRSLNYYNAGEQYWEQLWLDDGGDHTHYIEGKFDGRAMRFPRDRQGLRRLTLEKLGDSQIRQVGERRNDQQSDWSVDSALLYRKLVSDGSGNEATL